MSQNNMWCTVNMHLYEGKDEPSSFAYFMEIGLKDIKYKLDGSLSSQAEDYFAECKKEYNWPHIVNVARCSDYEGEIYSIQQRLRRTYNDDFRTNYGKCWLR